MVRVRFPDGQGLLRELLEMATAHGFGIDHVSTERVGHGAPGPDGKAVSTVEVTLHVHGKGSMDELTADMLEIRGVDAVVADDANRAEG